MQLAQILVLALLASLAIFMHILSCALFNNWWPMINLLSYCLAPLPLLAYWSSHGGDGLLDDSGNKAAQHWAEFASSVGAAVIFGLPLVMYHNRVIEQGAALMDLAGFLLLCATIGLGVIFHRQSEGGSFFGS
mmetsp:Transcript_16061/g.32487  ORF Transcript_16061/g.32487 Transcript_16061/m.32487 type:complete len:133 (-) Transcript_16061:136-534(-)